MRYTKLGSSDLTVSRICLGCMGFGEAGNGQPYRQSGNQVTKEKFL